MVELWFWIVSVAVALYAVLDGFDFGAGVLHLFVARTDGERRQVLGAIGPFWDGNEVWLLAGGGLLFLAFPRVLAAGFSGFYLAMFLVVWTLILRGIALEFRSHVAMDLWRSFWDAVFAGASVLMPILLGAALGNVVRGVPLDRAGYFTIPLFTGFRVANPVGILDWYTVLVGVFVLATLTAHGALFLLWKTEGPVHDRCRRAALPLWVVTALLAVLVTAATGLVNPTIFRNLPHAPLAWVAVALFLGGFCTVPVGLRLGRPLAAFLGSSAFIVGILAATAACVWPVMLRSTLDPAATLTALNASAGPAGLASGLGFLALGLPLVALWFTLLFRFHRGKVRPPGDEGGY